MPSIRRSSRPRGGRSPPRERRTEIRRSANFGHRSPLVSRRARGEKREAVAEISAIKQRWCAGRETEGFRERSRRILWERGRGYAAAGETRRRAKCSRYDLPPRKRKAVIAARGSPPLEKRAVPALRSRFRVIRVHFSSCDRATPRTAYCNAPRVEEGRKRGNPRRGGVQNSDNVRIRGSHERRGRPALGRRERSDVCSRGVTARAAPLLRRQMCIEGCFREDHGHIEERSTRLGVVPGVRRRRRRHLLFVPSTSEYRRAFFPRAKPGFGGADGRPGTGERGERERPVRRGAEDVRGGYRRKASAATPPRRTTATRAAGRRGGRTRRPPPRPAARRRGADARRPIRSGRRPTSGKYVACDPTFAGGVDDARNGDTRGFYRGDPSLCLEVRRNDRRTDVRRLLIGRGRARGGGAIGSVRDGRPGGSARSGEADCPAPMSHRRFIISSAPPPPPEDFRTAATKPSSQKAGSRHHVGSNFAPDQLSARATAFGKRTADAAGLSPRRRPRDKMRSNSRRRRSRARPPC